MRFYFGFSKRFSIKKIIKWIPLIATGLLAFFGIGNINAKALTNENVPYKAHICSYGGLFTDSNCTVYNISANCSTNGPVRNFSCYPTDSNYNNLRLTQKSVWYEYNNSSSSSTNCNSSQTISMTVDVILNDQFQVNGCSNYETDCGPFNTNALNYNYWNGGTTTSTRVLTKTSNTKASNVINQYWPLLGGYNTQNKSGVIIYAYSSSGYQTGQCTFVQYLEYKRVRFLCTAPAKATKYFIGQQIFNNYGGLGSSTIYARNAQYISNVSDPCVGGGSDMSSVTGAINNQTGQMMQGFQGIIDNNNSNTEEITNAIDGLTDGVNSATQDIMDKQDDTNDKLDDTNDKLDDVNDKLDGINDGIDGLTGNTTINNSDVSGFLSHIEEMIDDQPIQRLLTMPITLLNSFYNNVSVIECNPYNVNIALPNNGNMPLSFTCPNYNELIGSTGATLLDAFMCFALCWGIAHAAVHFYEECSSAKDTFDELYKGGK